MSSYPIFHFRLFYFTFCNKAACDNEGALVVISSRSYNHALNYSFDLIVCAWMWSSEETISWCINIQLWVHSNVWQKQLQTNERPRIIFGFIVIIHLISFFINALFWSMQHWVLIPSYYIVMPRWCVCVSVYEYHAVGGQYQRL